MSRVDTYRLELFAKQCPNMGPPFDEVGGILLSAAKELRDLRKLAMDIHVATGPTIGADASRSLICGLIRDYVRTHEAEE